MSETKQVDPWWEREPCMECGRSREEHAALLDVAAAARALLPWAENWLPDEAKDEGARAAYVALRAALTKLDGGTER